VHRWTAATANGRGTKLAATVAARIVDDVLERGWPVGEVLGSEAALLERYGVSRAVFREAVRLVEYEQVARMRRGPGGGLVVTEPSVDVIIDAAVVYLNRVDARLDEVFEARLVLEELAVELAPSRLQESDLGALRALIREERDGTSKDHRALHALIAAMTGNPALELFVEILNRVSLMYFRTFGKPGVLTHGIVKETHRAHAGIADAVMAGDVGLAKRRMRRHLEAEAAFIRRRRTTRQLLPDDVVLVRGDDDKRAEAVARAILYTVVAEQMPPGELLGSESDLMAEHDVSRAVLREAVRLLEQHHVAAMRRGPGGGLFVVAPSAASVTDLVALHLERRGINVAAVTELRVGVELAIVDLVVERMDDSDVGGLHDTLAREQEVSDAEFPAAGHDLHAALAVRSGNRVLELVALVLIRLTRLHQLEALSDRELRAVQHDVHGTHERIADAIIARDSHLARHRMRRHLDALGKYLQ
jgi:DNA-binding FadR family transcriptional regulator